MGISSQVQHYLEDRGLHYDVLSHPHSSNSMETARLSRVPAEAVAKSVILEDDDGYLMAVLPSTQHVQLGWLSREMNRRLRLAEEHELSRLFADCEPGAVPPVGAAFGMRTVFDDSLADLEEVYFEAGDHEKLIQMSGRDFLSMMADSPHARFGEHHWHH